MRAICVHPRRPGIQSIASRPGRHSKLAILALSMLSGCLASDSEQPVAPTTSYATAGSPQSVLAEPSSETAPIAADDVYSIDEDNLLDVPASGVLDNDSDADGNPIAAELVGGPANGKLTLRPDGSFTYAPDVNYFGPDNFTYRARDSFDEVSNVATVSVDVLSVNDLPFAVDDVYSTAEDTPLVVSAPGVLANDADVEGDPLTAVVVIGPGNGLLALGPDGSFTYSPAAGFSGMDVFTYRTQDAFGGVSAEAVVTIEVTPSPDTQLEDIEDEVAGLVGAGTLGSGNGNALRAKLESARASLADGDCDSARNKIGAFINQVSALVGTGRLTETEGQSLIDAANAVVEDLDC